jgi:hypothetical protein
MQQRPVASAELAWRGFIIATQPVRGLRAPPVSMPMQMLTLTVAAATSLGWHVIQVSSSAVFDKYLPSFLDQPGVQHERVTVRERSMLDGVLVHFLHPLHNAELELERAECMGSTNGMSPPPLTPSPAESSVIRWKCKMEMTVEQS